MNNNKYNTQQCAYKEYQSRKGVFTYEDIKILVDDFDEIWWRSNRLKKSMSCQEEICWRSASSQKASERLAALNIYECPESLEVVEPDILLKSFSLSE